MRELLKEARDVLRMVQTYFPSVEQMEAHTHDGLAVADVDACQKLAERIDTYLAAPRESAMEVVDQLDHLINDNQGIRADFDHNKAAALIESYGRRVPRAMLDDIWYKGNKHGYEQGEDEQDEEIQSIAAKYGVEVEG
jgi:hypothetical protein